MLPLRYPRSDDWGDEVVEAAGVAGQHVAGRQVGAQQRSDGADGQLPARRVAADQGDLEGQLVESVPTVEVAQAQVAHERPERCLDGGGQSPDERIRLADVDLASGLLLGDAARQLGAEVDAGEVGALQDAVDERAHVDTPRRVGQQRRRRAEAGVVGPDDNVGHGGAARRRRGLVGDDGQLGLAGDPGFVVSRGDGAVGGPPPARIELSQEHPGPKLDGSTGRTGPHRAVAADRAFDADASGSGLSQGFEAGHDLAVLGLARRRGCDVAVDGPGRRADG